jgi:hypothetical protein
MMIQDYAIIEFKPDQTLVSANDAGYEELRDGQIFSVSKGKVKASNSIDARFIDQIIKRREPTKLLVSTKEVERFVVLNFGFSPDCIRRTQHGNRLLEWANQI